MGVQGLQIRDRDEIVLFDPSETRTKESNTCASFWVFKTPKRNESKGDLSLRLEPQGAQSTDPIPRVKI